jgi:hypothetical protein
MNAPTRKRHYKPEPSATNAPRQRRLRERRKAEGWRRVTVWLSPEQVATLETLGGDAWLGRTVKALLTRAVADPSKPLAPVSDSSGGEHPEPATRGKAAFMTPEDKAALMAEVDSLLSQGLSSHAIARKFNEEGRRTVRGALFYGPKLLQEWRKWKEYHEHNDR